MAFTLVPTADLDGNEVAGIRVPDIEVPMATYMGWNLRDEKHGAGCLLAGLNRSYLESPPTQTDRKKSGDSRKAILGRYPTRHAYQAVIHTAGKQLVSEGYLLEAGLSLVTRSVFHFSRIAGLAVEVY